MPVLIHGDAAFAGQGVVAETFNLSALRGYGVGGTIHIITNNQVGFTTDAEDARSTRYASDLAKGFDVPIIHVNSDDAEACLAAVRLAMAYRDTFRRDVVIDLVGYRRHGHNEGDEPTYTQPQMYERIKDLPPVRARYAAQLASEGVAASADADQEFERVYQDLDAAQQRFKASLGKTSVADPVKATGPGQDPVTAVPPETLAGLNEQLLTVPEGFTANPKLKRQLDRRRTAIGPEGGIDWAHAEALSLASLLVEGVPVRLTGQDTERGTFSQRHLVLHDLKTGDSWAPMQRLPGATAPFELHNSPLSELATLGFEYGYSAEASEALVLWEAQFGDFINGAQIVVDQFLVSGLAKWRQTSRLTLLLPHGYEGNGPEHSSARLERFLQLAAQENIRVVNTTTAAQYFHLLRRQALDPNARPLIVMTPKGLLRLREASSSLTDLAEGRFQPVLDDPAVSDRAAVTRLVLTSGKLYYDIAGNERRAQASNVAVARLEELYPFPVAPAAALVASYPSLREVVWAQEEPQNMGAWRAIRHRLEEAVAGKPLRYVGRPWRASPSEGYPTSHQRAQGRIVEEVLEDAPS
jgi:2-oxoglutarate dehydrogenase E1 component